MTLTATTTTGTRSKIAQQKAEDTEREINDALHSAITESAARHPGFTPRIESFTPSPKHISAHAQRLTTISASNQILDILVVVSEGTRGDCHTEVSIFRRSFLDPDGAPPVDMIEFSESSAHTGVGDTLARHVEAFYQGVMWKGAM